MTHYIANSEITQKRIQDFWGRDSTVIHPPVEVERFIMRPPDEYFLLVSELVPHKRDRARARRRGEARKPVKVVGTGPALERLRAKYAGRAEFLGRVTDAALMDLYARAPALIVPNVEEFGIAAVEAQAAGRPVVALAQGGTSETVIDGETGILVRDQTPEAFAEVLADADWAAFQGVEIRRHAVTNFSTAAFMRKIRAEVDRVASGG